MKRIVACLLMGAMVLTSTGCGASDTGSQSHPAAAGQENGQTGKAGEGTSDGEPITLRVAHIGSDEHQYNLGCLMLQELLDEKTGGRIKLQIFGNSQLGAEREAIEGTIMGSIDMTVVTADGAVPSWVPDTAVLSIPYLFETKEEAYDVLDNYLAPRLAPAYEAAGLKNLGYMELGFRHFTNNKKTVRSASDMSGLIIRVQEAPVWFGLCNALNAVATPVAINELYTALQQGVVDGQENPLGTIVTSKFYEVQKYLTLDGHTYGCGSVFMNLEKWNSLSAEDQQLFQECVNAMIPMQRAKVTELENGYLETLKSSGMVIEENPDIESFKQATEGMEKQKDIAALFSDITIVQGVRDYLRDR